MITMAKKQTPTPTLTTISNTTIKIKGTASMIKTHSITKDMMKITIINNTTKTMEITQMTALKHMVKMVKTIKTMTNMTIITINKMLIQAQKVLMTTRIMIRVLELQIHIIKMTEVHRIFDTWLLKIFFNCKLIFYT